MENFHDITVTTIDGKPQPLSEYAGKTLLVVNVASKCGLTPQYEALEQVHRKFQDRGFAVLGFPCNQFLEQEPATDEEIKTFCSTEYDVTFPMFSKIEVNGEGRHPLFAFLTAQPKGPALPGDIQWNFEKFVLDGKGAVVARFEPSTTPDADNVAKAIEKALG